MSSALSLFFCGRTLYEWVCTCVCMCVFSVCVRLVFTGSFQMIKQLYTIQSHTVTKYHHIYTLSAKVRQDVQALASLNRQHIFISRCSISAHTKTDNNKKKKNPSYFRGADANWHRIKDRRGRQLKQSDWLLKVTDGRCRSLNAPRKEEFWSLCAR